ncbi:MAG TPA: TetR/AcrR family transcriptional regulator [Ferruginibacter sp.]|nr:TetR/AcrR family transcriptional regulator [Ferruginibacter sp.]HMP19686.1 TetR/AcrR family transcriptional regulator [Ferruginibacter sp.]
MTELTTAERIKQKAHDLVMQYGIRSVSMDDIASGLGISKKTIYQFFADKDELVEAIISDKICDNQNCCLQDRARAKDAIHEVFLAMEMVQEVFQNMNPAVLYDMEKFHPRAYNHFLQHKYKFLHDVIKENLERGVEEGLYREDLDIDIMVKARLETMLLVFNQQVFPRNKYNMAYVETELTLHFLFGLASQKGHKLILKYQQERTKK